EGAFFFVAKKGVEKPLAVIDPYLHPTLASNDSSNKVESFGIQYTQNADILEQNEETGAVIPTHIRGSSAAKVVEEVANDVGDYGNKTNSVAIAEKSANEDSADSKTPKPNITESPKPSSLPEPSLQPIPIAMLPPGPISSIRGKPEIKIFKPPHVYPVQGFDFSSADGYINWKKMNESSRPRFIYARAVSWNGPDKTFVSRWSQAKALEIDRGAYMKFDFCRSPEEQFRTFSEIVPLYPDTLPLAIEIVNPKGENNRQLKCLNSIGMETSKAAILKLASSIRTHYGKTPLLYGNRHNLSTFLDQRSDEFMIWLGSYGASGIKLSGRNPWTLWQYSGTLNIEGVGKKTTGEVFFGTEEQYQLFKQGKSNVALDAVI
ncbi:MAG: glycoside hydrolase family 25 protein, partial [Methylobacter sp.]